MYVVSCCLCIVYTSLAQATQPSMERSHNRVNNATDFSRSVGPCGFVHGPFTARRGATIRNYVSSTPEAWTSHFSLTRPRTVSERTMRSRRSAVDRPRSVHERSIARRRFRTATATISWLYLKLEECTYITIYSRSKYNAPMICVRRNSFNLPTPWSRCHEIGYSYGRGYKPWGGYIDILLLPNVRCIHEWHVCISYGRQNCQSHHASRSCGRTPNNELSCSRPASLQQVMRTATVP